MKTKTPMMIQFEEMKKKHPDSILLFRVGDFYEVFGDDAKDAADILGITLTTRPADGEKIYLAGFPHHALDTYLPKLVRAGRRVAICEQLEEPRKKVKRGAPEPQPEPQPEPMPEPKPEEFQTLAEALGLPEIPKPQPKPQPQPQPYKIPEVKLSYVRDLECGYPVLKGSQEVAEFLLSVWDPETIDYHESIKAILLNNRNKVLGIITISEGSATASVFDVKKFLTAALLMNAQSVIMAHNHPSGNLIPSPSDDGITRSAKNGLEAVGMRLLDHVIITSSGYYSYCDQSRLVV